MSVQREQTEQRTSVEPGMSEGVKKFRSHVNLQQGRSQIDSGSAKGAHFPYESQGKGVQHERIEQKVSKEPGESGGV